MPYNTCADTIFNPAGDPLPLASGFFIDLGLERGHSAPFGNSDGHSEGAATQQEISVEGDLTQGPARRARVAHLPGPAHTETKDDYLPLFPNFTEHDVAQELLTSDTFDNWKTKDFISSKELLPSIPQTYHSGVQEIQSNMVAITKESGLKWEDLSVGIQWIILLRLCEKQSFGVAVFHQLKLHKSQIHNFVTTYINFCDEWNAFERAAFQRSACLKTYTDMEGSSLAEWLHENRPPQPIDRITDEDAQKGLCFLSERGVNHNINFQEWVQQKDAKHFANIEIDKPILQDCIDHLILRRAAAANLLPIHELKQTIKDHAIKKCNNEHNFHVRDAMINDAFFGTFKDVVPFEDDYWCNTVEISSRAQAVLDTLSADLQIDSPIPTPVSHHERQHIRDETYKALKRMVPDLKPQYVSGLLFKTRWEADNGYPIRHVADYDLTDYTAEMQYVPEGQVQEMPPHAPISLQTIAEEPHFQASGYFASQTFDLPAGQPMRHQTERYESYSSLCFNTSKYHSPAAYAAALAGERNASRPRIGAARSRFMTSNNKGQLMVGMAADPSSAAAQTSQNPRFTRQPAEGVFRTQLEVPRRAMEAEPATLPDLRPTGDFEPENVTSALDRSQRARRPSARARESLRYALEMVQSTEITPEKSRGKKARYTRSSRKEPDKDKDKDEREKCSKDDSENIRLRSGSTKETGTEAQTAAAELVGFCIRAGNDLIHLNSSILPSWPGIVNEAPTPEIGSKHQLALVDEPGHSGSETSTTVDVAEFAVEAEQAYYAVRADHINPAAQVPRHLQMNRDDIQATLVSKEAEFTRAEAMLQGINGPTARRAELAGVADSATFAIHATNASFTLEGFKGIHSKA
ncbi:hypothetical protein GGI43DRAFT_430202 [Trichoderma evansii]